MLLFVIEAKSNDRQSTFIKRVGFKKPRHGGIDVRAVVEYPGQSRTR